MNLRIPDVLPMADALNAGSLPREPAVASSPSSVAGPNGNNSQGQTGSRPAQDFRSQLDQQMKAEKQEAGPQQPKGTSSEKAPDSSEPRLPDAVNQQHRLMQAKKSPVKKGAAAATPASAVEGFTPEKAQVSSPPPSTMAPTMEAPSKPGSSPKAAVPEKRNTKEKQPLDAEELFPGPAPKKAWPASEETQKQEPLDPLARLGLSVPQVTEATAAEKPQVRGERALEEKLFSVETTTLPTSTPHASSVEAQNVSGTLPASPSVALEAPREVSQFISLLPTQAQEEASLRAAVHPNVAHLTVDTGEAGSLSVRLMVKDGVTDIQVAGPAASVVEARESELRVALAQEGLALGQFDLNQRDSNRYAPFEREDLPTRAPRSSSTNNPSHPEPGQRSGTGRMHIKA